MNKTIENALAFARKDYEMTVKNGVSLNPFSTVGARHDWQRGYDGAPLSAWEGLPEFNGAYQRGKAARQLVNAA